MNLAAARLALTVIDSVLADCHAYEFRPRVIRTGDAWPILRRVEPSTFGSCRAFWDVVIVLATDEESAAKVMDDSAVHAIDILSHHGFTPVAATAQTISADGQEFLALVVEVITEVEK